MNIDSNLYVKMLFIPRFGEPISYFEGNICENSKDTFKIKIKKNDSVEIKVESMKIDKLKSKNKQLYLRRTPWLIDECVNMIRVVINNVYYQMETSSYSFIIPEDTLYKYKEFRLTYLWSLTLSKSYKFLGNLYDDVYFIDVSDYNRNYDYIQSNFSNSIYNENIQLKIIRRSENKLFFLFLNDREYELERISNSHKDIVEYIYNYLPSYRINPFYINHFYQNITPRCQ